MKELYSKIYHNLQKIDFESIWHGFSPCEFALYDEHKVYFLIELSQLITAFLAILLFSMMESLLQSGR